MIFETERLYVRRWESNDLNALHELYNDSAIKQLITLPVTIEETRHIFEDQLNLYKHQIPFGRYFIMEKGSDNFIGLLLFRNDSKMEGVEIGYSLIKNRWQKGYATETVKESINWLFESKGFSSMYAITDWDNESSKNVLLKCGFHPRKTFYEDSQMMNLFGLNKDISALQ